MEGPVAYLQATLLRRGYKRLRTCPKLASRILMGREQKWGPLAEGRGCNLHYALCEIGPWQGSGVVCEKEKNSARRCEHNTHGWHLRGTTLVR